MKYEHETYMSIAKSMAINSYSRRKKVGACLVTEQGVLLTGYNGTVSGSDNNCEIEEEYYEFVGSGTLSPFQICTTLKTKAETLHAEQNCILKAARQGVSTLNSKAYVTLSPCERCAPMIAQAGVKAVYYLEQYRDTKGIDLLKEYGVECVQLNLKGEQI